MKNVEGKLRDKIAIEALKSIVSKETCRVGYAVSPDCRWPSDVLEFHKAVAECAYRYADAMLAARKDAQ